MTGSWSDSVIKTSFCAASISACKNGNSNQLVHVKVVEVMLKQTVKKVAGFMINGLPQKSASQNPQSCKSSISHFLKKIKSWMDKLFESKITEPG